MTPKLPFDDSTVKAREARLAAAVTALDVEREREAAALRRKLNEIAVSNARAVTKLRAAHAADAEARADWIAREAIAALVVPFRAFAADANRPAALAMSAVFKEWHALACTQIGPRTSLGPASAGLVDAVLVAAAIVLAERDPGAVPALVAGITGPGASNGDVTDAANAALLGGDAATIVQALERLEARVAHLATSNRQPGPDSTALWGSICGSFGGPRRDALLSAIRSARKLGTSNAIAATGLPLHH